MSDQRIQYSEEMVGANHPTKSDTLNRLALVETDTDGKGKYRYLKKQTSDPSTDADEMALYVKDDGGQLKLYIRDESDGSVTEVKGGGFEVVEKGEYTTSPSVISDKIYTREDEIVLADNYDLATHVAHLSSANQIFGEVAPQFWLAADGTIQLRSASIPNWETVAWEIRKYEGLSGDIQHGRTATTSMGAGDTYQDITINELDDYELASVNLNHVGDWPFGASYPRCTSISAVLTSNTNLRGKIWNSDGAGYNAYWSWTVIPGSA